MDGDRRTDRDGAGPPYCSNCGTGLESSMNYCPTCGAAAGTGSTRARTETGRSRRTRGARETRREPSTGAVTDREVLERRIARASRDGWELEHDFGDHAVMVQRSFGTVNEHAVVALVTVWFTMGIGNALFGAYRYFGDAERMVLRAESVDGDAADRESSRSTVLGRATAAICWLTAAIVAAIGVQLGTAVATVLFFTLAFLVAMLGVGALPSVRRRFADRHPMTANGRVRSVDERTVVSYDRPCAACADPVGQGLERTYRKEFCLLGVPLTGTEGRNYYCRQCANGTNVATRNRSGSDDIEANRGLEADSERETESA